MNLLKQSQEDAKSILAVEWMLGFEHETMCTVTDLGGSPLFVITPRVFGANPHTIAEDIVARHNASLGVD